MRRPVRRWWERGLQADVSAPKPVAKAEGQAQGIAKAQGDKAAPPPKVSKTVAAAPKPAAAASTLCKPFETTSTLTFPFLLSSLHSWRVGCRPTTNGATLEDCVSYGNFFTGYSWANSFDQYFSYQTPSSTLMTGVVSCAFWVRVQTSPVQWLMLKTRRGPSFLRFAPLTAYALPAQQSFPPLPSLLARMTLPARTHIVHSNNNEDRVCVGRSERH